MPERSCPACSRDMKQARLGPIPLDLCFPCGGTWFDDGELALLVRGGPEPIRKLGRQLRSAGAELREHRGRKCPVCWVPLSNFESPSMPGVRLDGCGLCQGFWVSLGALAAILQQVETKARLEAAARMTRDLPPAPALQPAPPIIPREETPPSTPPAPPSRAAEHKPIVKGHRCSACGETNSQGAAVCWACGGFIQPAGAGKCPGCAGGMTREMLDTVEFGFCAACGGVWVEDRTLDALRAQPEVYQEDLVYSLRDRTGAVALLPDVIPSCPHCHVSLQPELLGMVSVEPIQTCPQCYGSFLERGRLAELLIGKRL